MCLHPDSENVEVLKTRNNNYDWNTYDDSCEPVDKIIGLTERVGLLVFGKSYNFETSTAFLVSICVFAIHTWY